MNLTQTAYQIRELVPADYDRWSAIGALYDPEMPSADQMRKRRDEWVSEDPRHEVVAMDAEGNALGYARINRRSHQAPGAFYLSIDVEPDHEGKGVGSALLGELESYALPLGASIITAFAREGSDRVTSFYEHRGYPMERALFESTLDFTKYDASAFEQNRAEHIPGLEIVSWTELGDTEENRGRLYQVMAQSDNGPDMDIWGTPSQEIFENALFGAEWYMPDGVIVAIQDGAWAGMHSSGPLPDKEGAWTTDYTGVLPEFRRRGIAMALKLRSNEIAISHGAKSTITHNDSENHGMLAINVRLGFVKQPGWLQMRKRL